MLIQNSDFTKQNLNKVVAILLEIGTETAVRLVNDNTGWTYKGNSYTPFPFSIGGISASSKGEIPKIDITISNVTGLVGSLLKEDITNVPVNIYVLRAGEQEADLAFSFAVKNISYDAENLNVSCGAPVTFSKSCPSLHYSQACPWTYKGWRCKYSGSLPACNHTASDCKNHGNIARFGGFNNRVS